MAKNTTTTTKPAAKPATAKVAAKPATNKETTMQISENPTPFVVGQCYLIRTVTMIQTGRVVAVTGNFLVLEDAAWIAATARFADTLKTGTLGEVEPAEGRVFVGLGSIVDVYEWRHALPRTQI